MNEPIHAAGDPAADLYPRFGELWDWGERLVMIYGSPVRKQEHVYAVGWTTGACHEVPLRELTLRGDRRMLTAEDIVVKLRWWAAAGNSDAMWMLGWWFEGTDHPKSVWYYIAALRREGRLQDWALDHVRKCACSPSADGGAADAGLHGIPELDGGAVGSDWSGAVRNAECAGLAAHQDRSGQFRTFRPDGAMGGET